MAGAEAPSSTKRARSSSRRSSCRKKTFSTRCVSAICQFCHFCHFAFLCALIVAFFVHRFVGSLSFRLIACEGHGGVGAWRGARHMTSLLLSCHNQIKPHLIPCIPSASRLPLYISRTIVPTLSFSSHSTKKPNEADTNSLQSLLSTETG
jgi:hypothetical protein